MQRTCLLVLTVALVTGSVWAATAFVAEEHDGGNRIIGIDIDTGIEETLVTGLGPVSDIAVDQTGQQIYWLEVPEGIKRANLDGSCVEPLVGVGGSVPGVSGLVLDVPANQMYWNTASQLWRAHLDGANAVAILTPPVASLTGGLALDVENSKIYFSGIPPVPVDPIYRANLNGTGFELVFQHPTMLIGSIALDNQRDHIYFADTAGTGLHRVDQTGFGLISISPGPAIEGVDMDPGADQLYWSEATSMTIWSTSLPGGSPALLRQNFLRSTAFEVSSVSLPGAGMICGDCSGNQVGPDIVDALMAAQLAASMPVPSAQPALCDVNGSGDVEILDALLLAQAAAQTQVVLNCQ
jgi:hypothetical protein